MYCEAQEANPAEDLTYKWTKEDDDFTGQDSNRLEIDDIQRTLEGRYRCTATNQMTPTGKASVPGTGTKTVTVNVQCEYLTYTNITLVVCCAVRMVIK